jgi:hypothetical protein
MKQNSKENQLTGEGQIGLSAEIKALSNEVEISHEGKYTKDYWLNKSLDEKMRNYNDDAYDDYFQNS